MNAYKYQLKSPINGTSRKMAILKAFKIIKLKVVQARNLYKNIFYKNMGRKKVFLKQLKSVDVLIALTHHRDS